MLASQPGAMGVVSDAAGHQLVVAYRDAVMPPVSHTEVRVALVSKPEAAAVHLALMDEYDREHQARAYSGPLLGVDSLSVEDDPTLGTVVVNVNGGDLTRIRGFTQGLNRSVVIKETEPMHLAHRDGDVSPHYGGAAIAPSGRAGYCTSGFAVTNAFGDPFMTTASHCYYDIANGFGTWISWRTNSSGGDLLWGNADYYRAPVQRHDIALISPTYSTYSGRMYVDDTGSKPVSGASDITQSGTYCLSGSTSRTHCGLTVLSFNTSVCTATRCSDNVYKLHDSLTSWVGACAGDSGGPIYSDAVSSVIIRGMIIVYGGTARTTASPVNGWTLGCGRDLWAEKWSTFQSEWSLSIRLG